MGARRKWWAQDAGQPSKRAPHVLIYAGASLIELDPETHEPIIGPVDEWPDTGTRNPPWDLVGYPPPPEPDSRLTRDFGINGHFMAYGDASQAAETGVIRLVASGPTITLAGCMYSDDADAVGGIWTYSKDHSGEFTALFLEYDGSAWKHDLPGWNLAFGLSNAGNPDSVVVAPPEVNALAFALRLQVATGDYELVQSNDFGPLQTSTGTLPDIGPAYYPMGYFSVGTFYESPPPGVVQYLEARCYQQGQDLASLMAITTELRQRYGTMVELEPPTSCPRFYLSGKWPAAAITTGAWKLDATPAVSSGDGVTMCLLEFSPVLPGRVLLNGSTLELIDSGGAVQASRVLTWAEGDTLTITVDLVADELTVTGATTGNGTTPFDGAITWTAAELSAGCSSAGAGINSDAQQLFLGTLGAILDAADDSVIFDLNSPNFYFRNGGAFPENTMLNGKWSVPFSCSWDSSTPPGGIDYPAILCFRGKAGGCFLHVAGGVCSLYIEDDAGTLVLETPITFSADQQLELAFDFTSSPRTVTITGATTGNGTFGLGALNWTMPTTGNQAAVGHETGHSEEWFGTIGAFYGVE